jgi:hypothetical protein
MTENYVEGTEPKTNDADFYTGCGIRLVAPFADWQDDYNRWAGGAVSGAYSYGRFSWNICGFAPRPTAAPSQSPGTSNPGATQPPRNTPRPTATPRPTKRP